MNVEWRESYVKVSNIQGLINLPSDRKHKANLGAPHILARVWEDSTNTIEKTYNTFLVLSVTFYIYKYTEIIMQKDFSKIQTYCYGIVHSK